MCAWDPDYDDACHFREPNDTKAFLLDLEEAFFCVLLVLPFIQLRREIEDALGDATTGDDAAALRRLLAAHGAFWSVDAGAAFQRGVRRAPEAQLAAAARAGAAASATRTRPRATSRSPGSSTRARSATPSSRALFTAQGRHGRQLGAAGDLHRAPAAPAPRAAKVAVAVALGLVGLGMLRLHNVASGERHAGRRHAREGAADGAAGRGAGRRRPRGGRLRRPARLRRRGGGGLAGAARRGAQGVAGLDAGVARSPGVPALVGGGFGALGHASSFHNGVVRARPG
ncbi:hypothetical protein SO694_00060167 [Aureococcus anophagefferens]|uniref:Uncharacterized protein n=1 Tax=Aureococcus anophagefferens TaxID=44056 RepID=A0ABR1FR26_AURAN